MNRGQFTDTNTAIINEMLPDEPEWTCKELRLLPYLMSLTLDHGRIDPRKVNPHERKTLSRWRQAGYIKGGASEPIEMSKMFWSATCMMLRESYAYRGD